MDPINLLRVLAILISAFGAYWGTKYDFHEKGKLTPHGRTAIFLILLGLIASVSIEVHNITHENDTRTKIISKLDSASLSLTQHLADANSAIDWMTEDVQCRTDSLNTAIRSQKQQLGNLKTMTQQQKDMMVHNIAKVKLIESNLQYAINRSSSIITGYEMKIDLLYDHIKERWPIMHDILLHNLDRSDRLGSGVMFYWPEGEMILDSLQRVTHFYESFYLDFLLKKNKVTDANEMAFSASYYPGNKIAGNEKIKFSPHGVDQLDVEIENPSLGIRRSGSSALLSEEDFRQAASSLIFEIIITPDKENIPPPALRGFSFITYSQEGRMERALNLQKLERIVGLKGAIVYTAPLNILVRPDERFFGQEVRSK